MRGITRTAILLLLMLSCSLVFAQQAPPVAVNDSINIYFGDVEFPDTTIHYPVTLNDFDPSGGEFVIAEAYAQWSEPYAVPFSDSTIDIFYSGSSFYSLIERVYYYRLRNVVDTTILSNWAFLHTNPAIHPDYPVARNDTIHGIPGYPAEVPVLENDYHPLGDSMFIDFGSISPINDSLIVLMLDDYIDRNSFQFYYSIEDTGTFLEGLDAALIYVQLPEVEYYDSLDINNISARFNSFGMHFWDMDGKAQFEVPKGKGTSSLFSSTLWIAGKDDEGFIHAAAERYRSTGADYFPGPISDVYDTTYDLKWKKIWKVSREEVEYHRSHWWEAGYEPTPDISTWPGNGDPENGQALQLAPYFDRNENGIYEPLKGDAPRIKGDQALFFIFNDARIEHEESNSPALGVEVHGMAHAFDAPEDSALWNTVFLNYKIFNRSDTNYQDVLLGTFADFDLGNPWDDYIGCDVGKGMIFGCNGDDFDEYFISDDTLNGYGEHPPAQGILYLGGPKLSPDGVDNPRYDFLGNQIVDESINGMNFGDGIPDNERMGLNYFTIGFWYQVGWTFLYPDNPEKVYFNLTGRPLSGDTLMYGGYGSQSTFAVGPACRYLWPGDSDPWNWGTYGVPPNGGYNQNGLYWDEWSLGGSPGDRRGISSVGPFDLPAGDSVELDLAFPWARDYQGDETASLNLLKERAAYLRQLFEQEKELFSEIAETPYEKNQLFISPNPGGDHIRINTAQKMDGPEWQVFDVYGKAIGGGKLQGNSKHFQIHLKGIPAGIYVLVLMDQDNTVSSRYLKMR